MSMLTSCQEEAKKEAIVKEDNSELQAKLLKYTKEFNSRAKKDSISAERLEEIKLEYKNRLDSIKICSNWKGKITLLELDEVEAYSNDTVMMRIGIENTYGSGNQDYFSFIEVKPIPKNGQLYKKLNSIRKNSEVRFSGRILEAQFNNITPGYEFSNFFIVTRFSEIEAVN